MITLTSLSSIEYWSVVMHHAIDSSEDGPIKNNK